MTKTRPRVSFGDEGKETILALQALLLAAWQPTAAQPEFRECPTGVYARHDRACPSSGPHPFYLYFESNEARLTGRARASLDGIGENFRLSGALQSADIAILIESHTDRAGEADDNLALTRRQAETVRDYLIGRGVPGNVIGITYFGEQRAAATTADGVAEPDHRVTVVWAVAPENFVRSRTRNPAATPSAAIACQAFDVVPPIPGCIPSPIRLPFPIIIYFQGEVGEFDPATTGLLDQLVAAYRHGGSPRLILAGHTDSLGPSQDNVSRSARYAGAVRDYLVAHGIPASAITVQAFGEARPAIETPDGVSEPTNRRVEVTFAPGDGW